MKGELFTLKEFFDKTIEKHETKTNWHRRMREEGLIKQNYANSLTALKSKNCLLFVGDDTKIIPLRARKG